jgi:cell division protein FtsL
MDYSKSVDTIKKDFLVFCGVIRKRLFLIFCLFVLAVIIAIGLIFYKYAYKVVYGPAEKTEGEISINQSLYQEAKKQLDEAEQRAQEAEIKEFKNPFR